MSSNRPWSEYLSSEARDDQSDTLEPELDGERYTRLARTVDTLRENPMLANMDRQLALKLARIMSIYTDTQAAWERYQTLQPSVQDQVLPLKGLDFATFAHLHNDIQNLDLSDIDPSDRQTTIGNIDNNQINHLETERSLETIRDDGLHIELEPALIDDLRQFATETPREDYRRRLPLTELFKNDKRATINGLANSKLSLIAHDAFDHMWGFNFAEQTGLSNKYAAFFQQIGDPAKTDMYNRQSELVATTLFGYRLFKDTNNSFEPTFDIEKVHRVLSAQQLHHPEDFTVNQADALELINTTTNPHEISLIGYSVSNIHDEIVEQRRKHGRIKLLDEQTGAPERAMRTLEPEYVAFVVEMLHQLFQNDPRLQHDLLATQVLTERYLHEISVSPPGSSVPSLKLTLQDIRDCDPYAPELREAGQTDWFVENPGALANKYRPHGRPGNFSPA